MGQVVRASGGQPITNAVVHTVAKVDDHITIKTEETDASGRFLIGALPPDIYLVAVVAPGFGRRDVAVRVTELGGADIDVALLDAAVVSGVILDARNEPAFGADVQPVFWLEAPVSGPVAPPVDRRIREMSYYGRDRTGLDGTFYLDNLDPGRPFQVEAKAGDGRIGRSDLIVLEPGEMRSGLRIVIR